MPFGWLADRLRRWTRRAEERRTGLRRFYDPCGGPTRESMALPADVREAAESLDGARMTTDEACARLGSATARYGGELKTDGVRRQIFWYMPAGTAGSHVFFLIRFK